jgi:hypothetical protein
MAAPTPSTEPTTLIAGDTAKWLKSFPDFLASAGWVLAYTLINASGKITFSATANGDDYLVNVAAATTATWPAGTYSWRATVSLAGEVYTVETGTIVVAPAFGVATLDNRSTARIALANLDAYITNNNNLQAARYQIAGREIFRYPLSELLAVRDKLRIEVNRESAAADIARGLPDKRRVMVRFG